MPNQRIVSILRRTISKKPDTAQSVEDHEKFSKLKILLSTYQNTLMTEKELLSELRLAVKRNAKVIMLDNFSMISQSEDLASSLWEFAVRNKVTIALIVHSLKAETSRKTGSIYGLEGTRKLVNLAQVVVKVRRADEENQTIIEVVKNRPAGFRVKVNYTVNPAINEFKEHNAEEDQRYEQDEFGEPPDEQLTEEDEKTLIINHLKAELNRVENPKKSKTHEESSEASNVNPEQETESSEASNVNPEQETENLLTDLDTTKYLPVGKKPIVNPVACHCCKSILEMSYKRKHKHLKGHIRNSIRFRRIYPSAIIPLFVDL